MSCGRVPATKFDCVVIQIIWTILLAIFIFLGRYVIVRYYESGGEGELFPIFITGMLITGPIVLYCFVTYKNIVSD